MEADGCVKSCHAHQLLFRHLTTLPLIKQEAPSVELAVQALGHQEVIHGVAVWCVA